MHWKLNWSRHGKASQELSMSSFTLRYKLADQSALEWKFNIQNAPCK